MQQGSNGRTHTLYLARLLLRDTRSGHKPAVRYSKPYQERGGNTPAGWGIHQRGGGRAERRPLAIGELQR